MNDCRIVGLLGWERSVWYWRAMRTFCLFFLGWGFWCSSFFALTFWFIICNSTGHRSGVWWKYYSTKTRMGRTSLFLSLSLIRVSVCFGSFFILFCRSEMYSKDSTAIHFYLFLSSFSRHRSISQSMNVYGSLLLSIWKIYPLSILCGE